MREKRTRESAAASTRAAGSGGKVEPPSVHGVDLNGPGEGRAALHGAGGGEWGAWGWLGRGLGAGTGGGSGRHRAEIGREEEDEIGIGRAHV